MIDIRGLTKIYHVGDVDVHALRGVDLSVRRANLSPSSVPADPASRRCFTSWAD